MAQSHYGPFDRKSMPASWESTDNYIEQVLFTGKDVFLGLDDYAPQKSSFAQREIEKKAARIIRAIGNRQGRGRMRSDTTLRQARPPRSLVLITGEDLPPGYSVMARLYVIDVKRASINAESFTALQQQVWRLPHAMKAYLEWLAPQIPTLMTHLPEAFKHVHAEAMHAGHGHPRVPEIVAHLSIGMDLGLQFATEIGALSPAEAEELRAEAWAAFNAGAQEQGQRVAEEDPSVTVFGRLQTLLTQGRVALLPTNVALDAMDRAGVLPIGWRDDLHVYLLPDAAREAVARAMSGDGGHVPSVRFIGRALQHRHLLVEMDSGRLTKQVRLGGGRRHHVWKIPLAALGLADDGEPLPSPGNGAPVPNTMAAAPSDAEALS